MHVDICRPAEKVPRPCRITPEARRTAEAGFVDYAPYFTLCGSSRDIRKMGKRRSLTRNEMDWIEAVPSARCVDQSVKSPRHVAHMGKVEHAIGAFDPDSPCGRRRSGESRYHPVMMVANRTVNV